MASIRWNRYRRKSNVSGRKRSARIALITIIIFLFMTIQGFIVIDRNLSPALIEIAETKTKQIAADTLNHAIREELSTDIDINKLVFYEKDNDGRVVSANFNAAEYARIVGEATDLILTSLKKYENDNPEIAVPLGRATNITILGNTGPLVPVKIVPKGSPKVTLIPKLQEAGINMVLMSIVASIEVEVGIVIPFETKTISLPTEVPLVSTIFLGAVPQFYYNNSGGSSKQETTPPVPQLPVPSLPFGQ